MKIKTINITFFIIAYLISIPLEGFILAIIGYKTHYIATLIFHLIFFIFLLYIFSGTLIVDFKSDKEIIIIKWDKKPIYTKIENQIIHLSEIKNWKLLTGRGIDRLKIYLNNKESLKIDVNNLTDFGENSRKVDLILSFLNANNIKQS